MTLSHKKPANWNSARATRSPLRSAEIKTGGVGFRTGEQESFPVITSWFHPISKRDSDYHNLVFRGRFYALNFFYSIFTNRVNLLETLDSKHPIAQMVLFYAIVVGMFSCLGD